MYFPYAISFDCVASGVLLKAWNTAGMPELLHVVFAAV
jgi:hypothetical protein